MTYSELGTNTTDVRPTMYTASIPLILAAMATRVLGRWVNEVKNYGNALPRKANSERLCTGKKKMADSAEYSKEGGEWKLARFCDSQRLDVAVYNV